MNFMISLYLILSRLMQFFFGKISVKLRIFRALKTVIKPLIRKLSVNLTKKTTNTS